ncbi:hypothetical protein [Aminiphilus circumscriptus]|jgi:hypothetical protein|uniref:hypothetical protein n=1 Tax=Aminiphilus circumscriptus TaxID=290732 RepID=UPI000492E47E|nr:hypothetical protein [Aminiphilus circumscriptus]
MPEEKKDEQPGRSVRISVGKKKYAVYTRLDEETCSSVVALVQGIVEKMPFGVSQEEKLLLTCLRLALSVHHSAQLLSDAAKKAPKGDGRASLPEKSVSDLRRDGGDVPGKICSGDTPTVDVPSGDPSVPPPLSESSDAIEKDGGDEPERGVENL